MADIPRGNRPLSPHLTVYRLPMAAITSIMTRITGQAMLAGLLLIADWVVRSWIGYLVLFGSAWALWFHFLSGIRHLCYDAGLLLTRDDAQRASWMLIIGSVVLTLITAILFVF